ncbi:MAG: hypothetical protein GF364_12645 [Candidatus Lokiarchaeota archaeon]|nr:hypothetical protein [Candidatus Lokiarchaeota archaeon]
MKSVSDEFYVSTDDGSYTHLDNGEECFYRMKKDGSKKYGGFVNYLLEALFGRSNLLNKDNKKITDKLQKYTTYGPQSLVGRYKFEDIAEVVTVGPLPMMWSIVNVMAGNGHYDPSSDYVPTIPKTLVSLNTIMVDGTGMCGGCRVRIYNPKKKKFETKFTCVDGPVFNGHCVDFESIMRRTRQYKPKEVEAVKYMEIVGW